MRFGHCARIAAMAVVIGGLPSFETAARDLKPFAPGASQRAGFSSERLARIEAAFNKLVADGKIPGAVILISRKGQIVYSNAFGFQDKSANKPMKSDAIFRIYS